MSPSYWGGGENLLETPTPFHAVPPRARLGNVLLRAPHGRVSYLSPCQRPCGAGRQRTQRPVAFPRPLSDYAADRGSEPTELGQEPTLCRTQPSFGTFIYTVEDQGAFALGLVLGRARGRGRTHLVSPLDGQDGISSNKGSRPPCSHVSQRRHTRLGGGPTCLWVRLANAAR